MLYIDQRVDSMAVGTGSVATFVCGAGVGLFFFFFFLELGNR